MRANPRTGTEARHYGCRKAPLTPTTNPLNLAAMGVLAAVGLTLPIAIMSRWLVVRLAPLVVPKGKLKTWGVSWATGLAGSYLAGLVAPGPTLAGVSLWGAVAGSLLGIAALGLYPFLKIMVGRV